MMDYDRWMNAEPPPGDPWAGNDPFDRGVNPWQGRDTWVGDLEDDTTSWESGNYGSSSNAQPHSMYACLDPGDFTYTVGIFIQISFIFIYGLIYQCCFRENPSVTKMHMFVFYINSSFWGWAIYLLLYKGVCNGYDGTHIFVTATGFAALFGLCSCCEMCCSREGGYFRHQKTMKECIKYMNKMKETAPIHRVEIECYHYRVTYRTDSRGHATTRKTKVTTYREWRDFLYDRWDDDSDYPNLPQISMETPFVAVESSTHISPGDDFTNIQFQNFRRNLVEENRFRDAYIDETVRTLVPGHEAKVTAKSDKENEVPWWLNSSLFCLLGVFFCSCPLRVLFRSKSKQHKFVIRKVYYLDPESEYIDNMGVNVTVNIVGNQGTVNVGGNNQGISMVEQGPASQGQKQFPPQQQTYSSPSGQNNPPSGKQQQSWYPSSSQQYSKPVAQKYPPPQTHSYPTKAPAANQDPKPTAPPSFNPNFP